MALNDPHAHKREKIEACGSCRFFFPSPKCHANGGRDGHVTGDCRRMPPTANSSGHATTYIDGWCGEFKEDSHKVAHLKALDESAKKDKPQEK